MDIFWAATRCCDGVVLRHFLSVVSCWQLQHMIPLSWGECYRHCRLATRPRCVFGHRHGVRFSWRGCPVSEVIRCFCEWVCARTAWVGRWMMDTLGMVFSTLRIVSDLKIEQRDLLQFMVVSCGKIECVGDFGWVLFFVHSVMYTLVNVHEAAINDSMEICRLNWLVIEIMQHMFSDHNVIGNVVCGAPFVLAISSVRVDLLSCGWIFAEILRYCRCVTSTSWCSLGTDMVNG